MKLFSMHSLNGKDPLLKPVFSTANKIRRVIFYISWTILCRFTPSPLHGWRIFILRLFGATIGKNNFIYPSCKIWAPWLLFTEDVVTIGPRVEVYNPGGVRLGHHTILSQDAFLCGATHDYNSPNFTYLKKPISTEPYVWISAKAVVLPGVHCGEGSILGAASITSKDMEAWTVYAGNPARPVKKRNCFINSIGQVYKTGVAGVEHDV
jgi:putative colanic acid biosynthesis acetyltransferase WcaF